MFFLLLNNSGVINKIKNKLGFKCIFLLNGKIVSFVFKVIWINGIGINGIKWLMILDRLIKVNKINIVRKNFMKIIDFYFYLYFFKGIMLFFFIYFIVFSLCFLC